MRFGKVKAHAGLACRVSNLKGWILLALGKPALSLLLLWAAFWSTQAVVKSNAFAQDTPLSSTTSVIQSTTWNNVAYTQAWRLGAREPSTNDTVRQSDIAPASDQRVVDTVSRDRNQFASRPVRRTCHVGAGCSTTEEDTSANPGAANSPDQVYYSDGSGSLTNGYADSPRFGLLAIGDWFRVTISLGAAISRTPAKDRLSVSDETSRVNGTSIASENTIAPPTPLLIMHLGSYDLPVALSDEQLGDNER